MEIYDHTKALNTAKVQARNGIPQKVWVDYSPAKVNAWGQSPFYLCEDKPTPNAELLCTVDKVGNVTHFTPHPPASS